MNPNDLNMCLVSRILKAEELRIAQAGRTKPMAYQAWEGEGEKKPFYQRKNKYKANSSKLEWVKNAKCFNCDKKGHLKREQAQTASANLDPTSRPSCFTFLARSNSDEQEEKGPRRELKTC
jgi:hypothetical protein